ncbi:hypothetical protein [Aureivirga sp. CE67]|uniref:hypothetical protein n=1 Tax=Aureivirga sp. CE67 TaxID=1788983 RepID=UPI0018CA8502|nr:hypothetical protein [Aureivirga sp. CE67]
MKTLPIIALFFSSFLFAQQNSESLDYDQNPNYKISQEKYMKEGQQYVALEGTTLQQTYKAIDPMEEKRELKALKKKYRAQRLKWRHEERMEKYKNGYVEYYEVPRSSINFGWGWNNWGRYYNPFSFNYGLYF